jgi:spermidine/putrescine transport system ATP-binding protein
VGTARHHSCFGSEAVYEIEAAGGHMVKVLRFNVRRYEDRGFDYDQPV